MPEQLGPPYAPPANISTILTVGRDRGFPDEINREWLVRIGIADSLVPRNLHALQFLGLIDKDDHKTDLAEKIRVAPSDKYAAALEAIIREAYARIFQVVDPATASRTNIDDAFRFEKPDGQRPRMVACFVGLCKLAGMTLKEPPIGGRPTGTETGQQQRKNTTGSKRETTPKREFQVPTPPQTSSSIDDDLVDKLLAKYPAFNPEWSEQVQEKWFEGFARIQEHIKK